MKPTTTKRNYGVELLHPQKKTSPMKAAKTAAQDVIDAHFKCAISISTCQNNTLTKRHSVPFTEPL
eukprot:scaffold1500_cov106-Skeletonema_dohrnii-CCMP3373.AAC.8